MVSNIFQLWVLLKLGPRSVLPNTTPCFKVKPMIKGSYPIHINLGLALLFTTRDNEMMKKKEFIL